MSAASFDPFALPSGFDPLACFFTAAATLERLDGVRMLRLAAVDWCSWLHDAYRPVGLLEAGASPLRAECLGFLAFARPEAAVLTRVHDGVAPSETSE